MIGARINNPDRGSVFIDENYSNLCLREKRTFQIPAGDSSVAFNTSCGLVAFSGGPFKVGQVDQNGGQAVFTFFAWETVSLTAYVLDYSSMGPQRYYEEPFGLRIRNPSDGSIVFDSRNKYIKVIDLIYSLNNDEIQEPPDKRYNTEIAVIQGYIPYRNFAAGTSEGTGFYQIVWYFVETDGGNFYVRTESTGGPSGQTYANIQTDYSFLILDVSDF